MLSGLQGERGHLLVCLGFCFFVFCFLFLFFLCFFFPGGAWHAGGKEGSFASCLEEGSGHLLLDMQREKGILLLGRCVTIPPSQIFLSNTDNTQFYRHLSGSGKSGKPATLA